MAKYVIERDCPYTTDFKFLVVDSAGTVRAGFDTYCDSAEFIKTVGRPNDYNIIQVREIRA